MKVFMSPHSYSVKEKFRWRDKLSGGPKAGCSDSHKQGSRECVDNNSIYVLCFSSLSWILFSWIAGTQDRWLWSSTSVHSVSPGVRSGWSWARDEKSSARGRNVIVFVPISFTFVNGLIFTSAPLRILALLSAFNFTRRTAAVVCGSGKGSTGEVALIQPIEWKGVLLWIETMFKSILSPTHWVTALFVSPAYIETN